VTLARLVSLVAPPLCWSCGATAARDGPLCGGCRAGLRWLDPEPVSVASLRVWAPVAYEGPARALVGALKFRGAAGIGDHMAAAMLARAPPDIVDNRTLVPVPLHPARLRRRGFNQAELLTAAMAARSAMPVALCLRRAGGDGAQVGRGRSERLEALRGSVAASAAVPGAALLVDDVLTTGATLAACTTPAGATSRGSPSRAR
jgi:predicted amidophosphoribosyltransferase